MAKLTRVCPPIRTWTFENKKQSESRLNREPVQSRVVYLNMSNIEEFLYTYLNGELVHKEKLSYDIETSNLEQETIEVDRKDYRVE